MPKPVFDAVELWYYGHEILDAACDIAKAFEDQPGDILLDDKDLKEAIIRLDRLLKKEFSISNTLLAPFDLTSDEIPF